MNDYKTIPKNAFGFIYKITNKLNGKYYIGKKQYFFKRKEHNSIVYVESDWKNYWGSSKILLNDFKEFGKDNFSREILCVCYSKQELTYKEVFYLFKYDVLNDEKSYNDNILGKFYKGEYDKKVNHLYKNKVLIKHKDKFKYISKTKQKFYKEDSDVNY